MNTRWLVKVRAGLRFTALHVERGAFGIVLALFALFVIRAIQRETLPWTPENLTKIAETAQSRVHATRAPQFQIPRYSRIAQESIRFASEASYALFTPFNPPKWQTHKRSTPELFAVHDLLASAGRGAFAMTVEDPDRSYATPGTRGQRWVCLVGVLEHHKQVEAFRDALWQSSYRNLERDRPDYVYFRVERAQMDPRSTETALSWVRQDVRRMYLRSESWAHDGVELVDPRYLPPERSGIRLAFPLGPLEDRPWGPEVCHARIPLQAAASDRVAHTKTLQAASGGSEASQEPDYLLFRYFDYDVEPGKQYRYRVRLVLANPNYAVPAHRLEDDGWATIRYVESDWSEPSAAIEVPEDTSVLAGPSRTPGLRATVLLTKFLTATGETDYEAFPARAGQLLDFPGRMLRAPLPSNQAARSYLATNGMSPHPSPSPATEDRFRHATVASPLELPPGARTVDYASGALVLDVRGGQSMPGRSRLAEPASILVMDRHGSLVVRNELDDRSDVPPDRQPESPTGTIYAQRESSGARTASGDALLQ